MLKRKVLIPVAAIMAMSSTTNIFAEKSELNNSEYKEVTYKIAKVKPTIGLNVRTTPEVNEGNKIFAAKKGIELEIVGQEGNWYKVELENNKYGWINSNYVEVENEDIYVNVNRLNFREYKSLDAKIQKVLNKGTKVELLEQSGDWLKVKYEGKEGYVYSKYITDEKPKVEIEKTDVSTSTESVNNAEENKSQSSNSFQTNSQSKPSNQNQQNISQETSSNSSKEEASTNSSSSNSPKEEASTNSSSSNSSKEESSTNSSSSNSSKEETSTNSSTSSNKQSSIVSLAKSQLGKPYVWGAEGPSSFDCSGLTSYVYKNGAGVGLPRTSSSQSTYGDTVSRSNLKPGDLVFFSTNGTGNVSHVGIYIGNGEMIHSPKPGDVVKKSNINSSYWSKAYLWSKRVL